MIKYGGYSLVGHLQLEYGFKVTSIALANALQLCLRSTALLTLLQLCLHSTTLAYEATAFDLLMLLQREVAASVRGNVEPFI